jgi:hypothetical protein
MCCGSHGSVTVHRLVFVGHVYQVDVGIYIIYQGETWDILTDFDVYQRRTSAGQNYCDACTPPELFPSRAALWVAHCFEPLLAWANDHLQVSQWLCLFGEPEGSTWAELTPAEDVPARMSRNDVVCLSRGARDTLQDSRFLKAFSRIIQPPLRRQWRTASPHTGRGDTRSQQVWPPGGDEKTHSGIRRDRALILDGHALVIVHPRESPFAVRTPLRETR